MKSNFTAQGLFKVLLELKNEEEKVSAPGGGDVSDYLKRKTGKKTVLVRKLMKDLDSLGYIRSSFHDNKLIEIQLLKNSVEPFDFQAIKPPAERHFALFLDYVNLEQNMPYKDRFRDFSWLTDPILKMGKILFAFVFIPEHYSTRAPIMLLSNKHRFHVILCPRQIS